MSSIRIGSRVSGEVGVVLSKTKSNQGRREERKNLFPWASVILLLIWIKSGWSIGSISSKKCHAHSPKTLQVEKNPFSSQNKLYGNDTNVFIEECYTLDPATCVYMISRQSSVATATIDNPACFVFGEQINILPPAAIYSSRG